MDKKDNYLKIVMASPNMSKIVREAFDAPIGSTRRMKARTIIKSIRNASMKDGQGGGTTGLLPNFSYQQPTTNGALSSTLNNYNAFNDSINVSQPNNIMKPAPNVSNIDTTRSSSGILPSFVKGAYNVAKSGLGYGFQLSDTMFGVMDNLGIAIQNVWPHLLGSDVVPFQKYRPITEETGPYDSIASSLLNRPKTTTNKAVNAIPSQTAQNQPVSNGFNVKYSPIDYSNLTSGVASAQNIPEESTGGIPELPMWLQSYVIERANQGVPFETVRDEIMSSKEALSQIFPNINKEDLPSGTLARTIKDLESRLQEQVGLDDMYKERMNLVAEGRYLPQDLMDYVQGRDEYVNKVENLISEVKKQSLEGGWATDPQAASSNEKYLNTLYLLKGQQNKRYIDLINTAITKRDADQASLDSRIEAAYNTYSKALELEVPMAQEEYNRIYSDVTGYLNQISASLNASNNIFGSSTPSLGMLSIDGAKNTAKDTIESSKIKLTEDFAQLNQIFRPGDAEQILPTGLYTKIGEALSLNYDPKVIYMYLQQSVDLAKISANTDPNMGIDNLNELRNAFLDLKRSGIDSILGIPNAADNLYSLTISALNGPISSYIRDNASVIQDALEDLTDGVKSLSDTEQINEWKNKYGSSLNQTFINAILSYYEDPQVIANRRKAFDLSGRKPSKMTVDELTNSLSGAIAGMWGSETINMLQQ